MAINPVQGAVAQWSEQGTHNPSVAGSIPACPTNVAGHFRLIPYAVPVDAGLLVSVTLPREPI